MNCSSKILVSLIIPTRERAETLVYAIQTALLNQVQDNYEIIVSDNFSQDNTVEVINKFSDPRLIYINTGQRLSMSDNWEFALAKARGQYVIFIGDDDAVLPGGIKRLVALIREHQCDVYMWDPSIYFWPIDGKKASIRYLSPVRPMHEMNLQGLVSFVIANGGWQYYRLPGAYHAAVSMKILEQIRNKTGRVFHSTQPDVFTSIAVPVFAKTCLHTGQAITLHGASVKSNGGASIARDGFAVRSKFLREYADYQIHPTLFPGAPTLTNLLGDSCLVAMDVFPGFYGKMKFNYEAMWAYVWQLKYVSARFIVANRSRIDRYHPFSVFLFLFYAAMQSAVILRRQIINLIARLRPFTRDIPDNIRDFAILLDVLQR